MKRNLIRAIPLLVALLVTLWGSGPALASDTPAGAPLDLPCAKGVTVEILGQAMPTDGNGKALVAARLTIAPDGGFAAHTHPGTLTVWVDSGSLGLTQLDGMEMTINRAAVPGTPAVAETGALNTEVLVQPGDWFVEESTMVHEAWNRSDQLTVVILSGFVDPTQPLVQCA